MLNSSYPCVIPYRVGVNAHHFEQDIGYGNCENFKGKAGAFEKAKKEAVTDAMKRALRNFGNVLGNCLYDKDYLKQVTRLKPKSYHKWSEADLHRHPDFIPPQQKPSVQIPAPVQPVPESVSAGSTANSDQQNDPMVDTTDDTAPIMVDGVILDEYSAYEESLLNDDDDDMLATVGGAFNNQNEPAPNPQLDVKPVLPQTLNNLRNPNPQQQPLGQPGMNNQQQQQQPRNPSNHANGPQGVPSPRVFQGANGPGNVQANPQANQQVRQPIQTGQNMNGPAPPPQRPLPQSRATSLNMTNRPPIGPGQNANGAPKFNGGGSTGPGGNPFVSNNNNNLNGNTAGAQQTFNGPRPGSIVSADSPANNNNNHNNPQTPVSGPYTGFISARDAHKVLNPGASPNFADIRRFDPTLESPSIPKTLPVELRVSKPLAAADVARYKAGNSPATPAGGAGRLAGQGPNRPQGVGNILNPSADPNRRIGMPGSGAGNWAGGQFRSPVPAGGIKRGAAEPLARSAAVSGDGAGTGGRMGDSPGLVLDDHEKKMRSGA